MGGLERRNDKCHRASKLTQMNYVCFEGERQLEEESELNSLKSKMGGFCDRSMNYTVLLKTKEVIILKLDLSNSTISFLQEDHANRWHTPRWVFGGYFDKCAGPWFNGVREAWLERRNQRSASVINGGNTRVT